MVTKRLVVLANSIRHAPCRCVAGREVLSDRPPVKLGGWLRPVSEHGDGELYEQEIKLEDKSQPQVLDVIDVHLDRPQAGRAQPENWFVARRQTWRKVGHMARSYLAVLEEEPATLWHRQGWKSDRIPAAATASMQIPQSLYLIRAKEFRLRFWTEPLPTNASATASAATARDAVHASDGGSSATAWTPTASQKHYRRAVFRYHGVEYNLPLTDPLVMDRYEREMPQVGEPAREIALPSGGECLLCVSLTREYKGFHYKVAATVVEL
jgi:hypothetical protein